MHEFHSKDFFYYPYSQFGNQGIRYREPSEIIENIRNSLPISFLQQRYFSYQNVKDYFSLNNNLIDSKVSYVQMEHVYKLL